MNNWCCSLLSNCISLSHSKQRQGDWCIISDFRCQIYLHTHIRQCLVGSFTSWNYIFMMEMYFITNCCDVSYSTLTVEVQYKLSGLIITIIILHKPCAQISIWHIAVVHVKQLLQVNKTFTFLVDQIDSFDFLGCPWR